MISVFQPSIRAAGNENHCDQAGEKRNHHKDDALSAYSLDNHRGQLDIGLLNRALSLFVDDSLAWNKVDCRG